jgi:hypothetical protein
MSSRLNGNGIAIPNHISSIMKSNAPSESEKNEVAKWIVESAQNACKIDDEGKKIDERCFKRTKNEIANKLKDLKTKR